MPKKQKSLKQLALENIKTKHKIINKWISKGIPYLYDDNGVFVRDTDGEMILDFYPSSLRSFYSWKGEQNCERTRNSIPSITGTGTTTLDHHPDLKKDIINSIATLSQKAAAQLASSNKSHVNTQLQESLKLTKLQREEAERKYLLIIEEHEKLKVLLRKEKRAHDQSKYVMQKAIDSKDEDISFLKAQLSELRKSFAKGVFTEASKVRQ